MHIRKQGLEDIFFVIIILIAVALFTVILGKVWSDIRTPLETGLDSALPEDTGGFNLTQTLDQTTGSTRLFDKLLPFIIIGLIGFIMITASIIFQHPIMLFVGIIVLAVAVILAGVYSNVYEAITDTAEFSSTSSEFGITSLFMQHLPKIAIILFVIIGAVLWGRSGSRGGGGI